MKTLLASVAAIVMGASIACSNSATGPSDVNSTTGGGFSVAVRPSPVTANRCNPQCAGESGSGSFAFAADMTIDVQNSSASSATVTLVTLTASAGGTTFPPLTVSSDEIDQAGANRLDGHATVSIPMSIVYNTPSNQANLSVSISVQLTDSRNGQVTTTGQVNVL